ncbi:unnamed protein product [Brugia timori]|uniref:Uncharacterized protein n=1 Tax=Brugia timori TaxID=42155 RepID=A0A0R3R016_9BILA|nr:unnamed protein product [Brugia timori]
MFYGNILIKPTSSKSDSSNSISLPAACISATSDKFNVESRRNNCRPVNFLVPSTS